MSTGEGAERLGAQNLDSLCNACLCLNKQRIDLDRRITALHLRNYEDDEALWQKLEDLLQELADAAEQLASIAATRSTELRAKAEVLAMLMRSDDAEGNPVIPLGKTRALALSLTDDLAALRSDTGCGWINRLPSFVRRARRTRH